MLPFKVELSKRNIAIVIAVVVLLILFLVAVVGIGFLVFSDDKTSEFADLLELANSKL